MRKGFSGYSFRMNVKREITALFQVIAIYLNAAGEYKLGKIGTGMVYIMVSAGAEIVSSVIDIVHAANQIREVILYYDDFNQYMQEKEKENNCIARWIGYHGFKRFIGGRS